MSYTDHMRCQSCGSETLSDARFCGSCGVELRSEGSPPNSDGSVASSAGARPGADTVIVDPGAQAVPPLSAPPTSFQDGRYTVTKFLGEGASKRVFLVRDTLLDRDVAFALIKTANLDEAGRQRILREARTIGRLGEHSNIVQLFDMGDENGQPYLVSPVMTGGDVEQTVAVATDRRLALDRVLDIAKDVCRGLQFAHSQGIVHRDLKPGNVWLSADGTAQIGDFGLAVSDDHTRLTQEGTTMGTPSYMAPEQAMGQQTGPHSDLYSLGAMLYELVAGRPPFLGDSPLAIISQHIYAPPVAPSQHNPDSPKSLEALILRLLAKAPGDRPESAADVLVALEAIEPGEVRKDSGVFTVGGHGLDSLADGVFVGRHREMEELKAALEDVLAGRGRLVTLAGEPGVGKTRTAQELATYAVLRGARVLWGRCNESGGAPPYWPWIQVIRSYVAEREPDLLSPEMGIGGSVVAEIVPEVKDRLSDLNPASEIDDPEQARFRLFDSISTLLKNASGAQAMVIVLDNLHWADKASLLLLESLVQALRGSRLLVVGTYRDAELTRRHPLSEALGELTRERLLHRMPLRGLEQEDVARFMEATAGTSPPPGLAAAVYAQTEGNPLFVNEVVRLLAQEGELNPERLEARSNWSVSIPESVQDVIGRRLNKLSDRCNETLTIASVIGREFELNQLSRLLGDPSAGPGPGSPEGAPISEFELLEALEEALLGRVIEELPQARGSYRFAHALIQQTLAEELTTTGLVRLHARIAVALEELYGDDARAHAAELAYHFGEAELVLGSERIVAYSAAAGEQALATHAYEEALAHYERALVAKGGRRVAAESVSLVLGMARAQFATNQMEEALASLRAAFEYDVAAEDVPSVVAIAEHLPGLIGATEAIERAMALVPPGSWEAGRLLCGYGLSLSYESGDYPRAAEAFDGALAIARRESDLSLEMRILANAAAVEGFHLRCEESLEASLKAIELAGRAEDLPAEVQARYWAAYSLMATGNIEGARPHAAAVLPAAEKLRNRFWHAGALFIAQTVSQLEGDWQAARDLSSQGLSLGPEDGDLLSARALMEYEVGDFTQGESFLGQLLEASHNPKSEAGMESASAAMVIALAARIAGNIDRFSIAEAAAEKVLSEPRPILHYALLASTALGLMASIRGDATMAEESYQALRPYRGTMTTGITASIDRLLGILAHAANRLDAAMSHFEDATTFCRKGGYLPELAWAGCDYAQALVDRSAEGDRQKAATVLAESLRISTELGMLPLVERAQARMETLAG